MFKLLLIDLVAKRHYNLGHGVGRSGDLVEPQPKAVGSSIIAQLTNCLLLDLIHMMGIRSATKSILVPMATGMTLMLCFLALKLKQPNAKYILWSRIDQKACFKSIITAGLIPIIIDQRRDKDQGLVTNTEEFENKIKEIGANNILCIYSTTSCFAPRQCDNLIRLSDIAKTFNLFHVVNNAYGLQSTFLTHQIEQAIRTGRLDLFIQSTDKNLLVPVGGAIVAGPNKDLIADVAKSYAGRSSMSQSLDVFITLLSLGRVGYKKLVDTRKANFLFLKQEISNLAIEYGEKIIESKSNPISIAITLSKYDQNKCTELGSLLFTRGVSGARVVSLFDNKSIGGFNFNGWGKHSDDIDSPYLTIAAGLGVSKEEIMEFVKKLNKLLKQSITTV